MRKFAAASVVGLALVAGQAVASNGAAQTLAVGDRVGAVMGQSEALQPAGLTSFWAGQSFLNLFFGIVIPAAILTKITVDDIRLDDEDDSPT